MATLVSSAAATAASAPPSRGKRGAIAASVDSATIERLLRRSRRWRTPPVLPVKPVEAALTPPLPPIVAQPGERVLSVQSLLSVYGGSFLGSLVTHLWLFVAAALVALPEQVEPPRLNLIATGALLPEEITDSEEVVFEAPAATISADALAPEQASIATQASSEIDPGRAMGTLPEFELMSDGKPSLVATAKFTGADATEAGEGSASEGEGTGGSGGDPEGDQGAEFFGIQAQGSSFVFVCDCSRSMTGLKWFELQKELIRCIGELGPDRSFYIVLFDGEMHPMFEPIMREPALLPATSENVAKTRAWLANVRLGRNTSPFESVKFSLTLDPDAIFLLTDGEFSDYTAPYLRDFHKKRKTQKPSHPVVVHTIGFFEKNHQMVLQRIARDGDGTYKFVEGPQPVKQKRKSWNVVAPVGGMQNAWEGGFTPAGGGGMQQMPRPDAG